MKSNTLKLFTVILLLITFSCNSDSKKDLERAAHKICTCLDETKELNEVLMKASQNQDNDKVIAAMEEISKAAQIGFTCVDRTLEKFKIKGNAKLEQSLTDLLESDCPNAAEIIARE